MAWQSHSICAVITTPDTGIRLLCHLMLMAVSVDTWTINMGGLRLFLGPDSIQRCRLTSIWIPIVVIRRSYDRLISTMGFPILARCHLYIEWGPRSLQETAQQPKSTRVIDNKNNINEYMLSIARTFIAHFYAHINEYYLTEADIRGRHFAEHNLILFFWYGNCYSLIQISLKFVPEGPIKNKSTLV